MVLNGKKRREKKTGIWDWGHYQPKTILNDSILPSYFIKFTNTHIQVFLNIQHDINVYIVFYLYTHINDELVPYMYMTKSALSLFFVRKIRDKKCEWDRCDIPVLNIEYKCISQSKNHHWHINILHIEV